MPIVTLTQGGKVIRLITDDELLFNLGSTHGVEENMIFNVLDPATQDVIDPETGVNLGSIERVKSQVRAIKVSQRFSLARVYPSRGRSGIGITAQMLMEDKPPSTTLSGDIWPDGVKVGDPIAYVGKKVRP